MHAAVSYAVHLCSGSDRNDSDQTMAGKGSSPQTHVAHIYDTSNHVYKLTSQVQQLSITLRQDTAAMPAAFNLQTPTHHAGHYITLCLH